jgi:cation diffusion facilitator family transporter
MAQASMERKATRIAVVVAVALLLIKLAAYRSTGSTAVFSDAMESLVNVVASLLAVWSVWMAHRPADRTHPYGHGKAEFVSAAIEGGLVVAAAGAVAVEVGQRLDGPAAGAELLSFAGKALTAPVAHGAVAVTLAFAGDA